MTLTKSIRLAMGVTPVDHSPNPQTRDVTLAPAEAGDLFTRHKELPSKMAADWFHPGLAGGTEQLPVNRGKASCKALDASDVFILDFDAGIEIDATKEYFQDFDHWGYSSHSYTPENQKHRIILPLPRPITAEEYKQAFLALEVRLKTKLGDKALPDGKCSKPWQPIFLPSCPPDAARVSWLNDGKREFPVDRLIAEGRAMQDAEVAKHEGKLKSRKVHVGDSVISRFNAAHDIESLLDEHGYSREAGGRWLAPESQSGTPGVVILNDGRGEILFSHHGKESDPLADGVIHDYFDAWCILTGIGSRAEGTAKAAELLGISTKGKNSDGPGKASSSIAADDDDEFESVFPPPKPTDGMFYGLIGELAEVGSQNKEVHPVAVALNAMTMLGAAFGRDCYFMLGDTRHHCRIFGLHVGPTSRARKGDSRAFIGRVAESIAFRDAGLLGHSHGGGLSSREGLIALIPDTHESGPVKKDGTRAIVEGVQDKRLLVVEGEFANVLNQGKRDGNTLSAAIRDAFDGSPLKPAIKTDSMGVMAPHIGIMGNITPGELRYAASQNEVGNGFLNRFMMVYAARTRLIAMPKPTDRSFVEAYAVKVEEVVKFARGKYPEASNSREMTMTGEAVDVYTKAYEQGFLNQREASGTIEALLERRPAYVIRLAMLFALTDKKLEIDACHINAGLEWARYVTESVRFIYSDGTQVRQQYVLDSNGSKIVEFLRGKGEVGASRAEIRGEVFNRHLSSGDLERALLELLATTPPIIVQWQAERSDGKAGKPRTMYRLYGEKDMGCAVSVFSADRATTRVPAARLGCAVSNDCAVNPTTTTPIESPPLSDLTARSNLRAQPKGAPGGRATPVTALKTLTAQGVSKFSNRAEKLLCFIRDHQEGITRSDALKKCFRGNLNKGEMDAVINELTSSGTVVMEETVVRGKERAMYRLAQPTKKQSFFPGKSRGNFDEAPEDIALREELAAALGSDEGES
jgi:hypothetical protein